MTLLYSKTQLQFSTQAYQIRKRRSILQATIKTMVQIVNDLIPLLRIYLLKYWNKTSDIKSIPKESVML